MAKTGVPGKHAAGTPIKLSLGFIRSLFPVKGRHVRDRLYCDVSEELPGGHYVNRRAGQERDAPAPRGRSQMSATYSSRRGPSGRFPVERSVSGPVSPTPYQLSDGILLSQDTRTTVRKCGPCRRAAGPPPSQSLQGRNCQEMPDMDADGVEARHFCHHAGSCTLKVVCAHPRSTHRRRGVHRVHMVDRRGTSLIPIFGLSFHSCTLLPVHSWQVQ